MSYDDLHAFRGRAETLLRQAMEATSDAERGRLIDLAAHWQACALMGQRALADRQDIRKVA